MNRTPIHRKGCRCSACWPTRPGERSPVAKRLIVLAFMALVWGLAVLIIVKGAKP